jgi:hypothetical protein
MVSSRSDPGWKALELDRRHCRRMTQNRLRKNSLLQSHLTRDLSPRGLYCPLAEADDITGHFRDTGRDIVPRLPLE